MYMYVTSNHWIFWNLIWYDTLNHAQLILMMMHSYIVKYGLGIISNPQPHPAIIIHLANIEIMVDFHRKNCSSAPHKMQLSSKKQINVIPHQSSLYMITQMRCQPFKTFLKDMYILYTKMLSSATPVICLSYWLLLNIYPFTPKLHLTFLYFDMHWVLIWNHNHIKNLLICFKKVLGNVHKEFLKSPLTRIFHTWSLINLKWLTSLTINKIPSNFPIWFWY